MGRPVDTLADVPGLLTGSDSSLVPPARSAFSSPLHQLTSLCRSSGTNTRGSLQEPELSNIRWLFRLGLIHN